MDEQYDPAEVPPSPRAMVQYDQNRMKKSGRNMDK